MGYGNSSRTYLREHFKNIFFRGYFKLSVFTCLVGGSECVDGQKQPSGQPSHIPLLSHLDLLQVTMGFLGDLVVKESACNAGHTGSVPGSGRSPGEGNGNPL